MSGVRGKPLSGVPPIREQLRQVKQAGASIKGEVKLSAFEAKRKGAEALGEVVQFWLSVLRGEEIGGEVPTIDQRDRAAGQLADRCGLRKQTEAGIEVAGLPGMSIEFKNFDKPTE